MKIHIEIRFKHFFQRLFRGFSDAELWDLGDAFYQWLYPRLKAYWAMKRHTTPLDMKPADWERFLARSQKALETYLGDNGYLRFKRPLRVDHKQLYAELDELRQKLPEIWD
jgi:hypothetical protein